MRYVQNRGQWQKNEKAQQWVIPGWDDDDDEANISTRFKPKTVPENPFTTSYDTIQLV